MGNSRTPDKTIPRKVQRLRSLDGLRGVAALSIVVWHWQHFFIGGLFPHIPSVDELPFYRWLPFLYKSGWLAVDLFFCLSGFVFYWLYAGEVRSRSIAFTFFAWLRFSRLYPLHLATLALTAAGLAIYLRLTGVPFLYPWDDAYDFALQVSLASGWGFERGPSFNTPAWSISVEVLLYVIFFVINRTWRTSSIAVPLIAASVGHFFVYDWNEAIGRGVQAFFMGAVAFHAFRRFEGKSQAPTLAALITGALWLAVFSYFLGKATPLKMHFVAMLLFPATVLTLALCESAYGNVLGPLSRLGDWSYSIYMLHLPLQLGCALIATALGLSTGVFQSPITFLGFFAVLILVSWASHAKLEIPAQRWLRARLLFAAAAHC